MPTRIMGVQFQGSARDLHALIGRWNQLPGVQWSVRPTDYVGGSFDVEFSRKDGGTVSADDAQAWVASAIENAGK